MPNWCEGTLKVRGTFENLKKFVMNGLQPVADLGCDTTPLEVFNNDETYFFAISHSSHLYIKHTHRHFCESKYIEFCVDEPGEITILTLPMKAAWGMNANGLLNCCVEFHLDMKIQGFERGMEFSQIIEIVDGSIIQDDEIKYDNWNWDCPCPDLGG